MSLRGARSATWQSPSPVFVEPNISNLCHCMQELPNIMWLFLSNNELFLVRFFSNEWIYYYNPNVGFQIENGRGGTRTHDLTDVNRAL